MASEDLLEFLPRVRRAWGADTSADPSGWTPENPSWGQTEITALLLQERCGGRIVEGRYILPDGKVGVHFYNDFDQGIAFDATSHQYPEGTQIIKTNVVVATEVLLKNAVTAKRFRKMKARV